MGMTCTLLRVTKSELEEYLNDSSLLEDRIYDDESEDEDENLIDIDKSWDGIIFLLTGQNFENADHPLLQVLFSGQIIDNEQDLGYGPAHYLTPEQVTDLNNQISKITVEDLRQKYDPEKMTELDVYPNVWEDEGEESFEYLSDNFLEVQQLYSDASKNGQAIITIMS
jgi:Domain of unknown function (DUF1877)